MCRHPGACPLWPTSLLACLPAGAGLTWGPGIQESRSSPPESFSALHFLYDIHCKLAIVCYFLFICFSFQLQRKLHKLMALFYSCLNYNLSNCALCTKGFQSQLHGQMDEWIEGYMALAAQATMKTEIFKNQWWDEIALELLNAS